MAVLSVAVKPLKLAISSVALSLLLLGTGKLYDMWVATYPEKHVVEPNYGSPFPGNKDNRSEWLLMNSLTTLALLMMSGIAVKIWSEARERGLVWMTNEPKQIPPKAGMVRRFDWRRFNTAAAISAVVTTTVICLSIVGLVTLVISVYSNAQEYIGPPIIQQDPSVVAKHYKFSGWGQVVNHICWLVIGWGHVFIFVAISKMDTAITERARKR